MTIYYKTKTTSDYSIDGDDVWRMRSADAGSNRGNHYRSYYDRSRKVDNDNYRGINLANSSSSKNNSDRDRTNGCQYFCLILLALPIFMHCGFFEDLFASDKLSRNTIPRRGGRSLSENTRRRARDESSSSSSSTPLHSSSIAFDSLEALHRRRHRLARRKDPPEHITAGRTGPPSSPGGYPGGGGDHHRHPWEKTQHAVARRRTQDDGGLTFEDTEVPLLTVETVDDLRLNTTTNMTEQAQNISQVNEEIRDQKINKITSAEGRLRLTLLKDYDKNSYPWEWAWGQEFDNATHYRSAGGNVTTDAPFIDAKFINETANATHDLLRKGLPVEFGLNFHKVLELDVAESVADLVVWVRMRWVDPRLTWDPTENGGLKEASFFITDGTGGGETSEIWTPDMYLWNQEESMAGTLGNTYALVYSDGTVYWSRPGRIKSTCKYVGLENFPFDELGCALEFGSWVHSGLYLRPIPLDGIGYTIGGSETAGQSYAEYKLNNDKITVENIIYPPYPCCPEEDWPVLIYSLWFGRSSQYYIRGVILINILLNFAAFACFWIPPHQGERMGLAITCVLAAVASELVVAAKLPVCEELSWYTKFSLGSTTFALLVVFESAAVIFFFFYTGEDLRPTYIKWSQRKYQEQMNKKMDERARKGREKEENTMQDNSGNDDEGSQTNVKKDAPRVSWTAEKTLEFASDSGGNSFRSARGGSGADSLPGGDSLGGTPVQGALRASSSFDSDGDHYEGSRRDLLARSNSFWASERSMAVKMVDAGNFKSEEEAENNLKWQIVAGYIDEVSRIVVPLMFCIFLAWVANTRVSGETLLDGYNSAAGDADPLIT